MHLGLVHDIDVVGLCIVFPQKGFILTHVITRPVQNSTLPAKAVEVLKWPGKSPDCKHIENTGM